MDLRNCSRLSKHCTKLASEDEMRGVGPLPRSSVQSLCQIDPDFKAKNGIEFNEIVKFLCVCVCFLPIHSGHQVRWTYQPGSHRRKVTQDF